MYRVVKKSFKMEANPFSIAKKKAQYNSKVVNYWVFKKRLSKSTSIIQLDARHNSEAGVYRVVEKSQ